MDMTSFYFGPNDQDAGAAGPDIDMCLMCGDTDDSEHVCFPETNH